MKKQLVLAAVVMMSAQAYASKARVTALQNAKTVANDIQDSFDIPSRIMTFGDQATFEYGAPSITYTYAPAAGSGTVATPTGTTLVSPNAEGGFIRSFGGSKVGAYVGRQSTNYTLLAAGGAYGLGRGWSTVDGMVLDNPLTVFYGTKFGDIVFGANLYYANSNKKSATAKTTKSATGVTLSAGDGVWEAYTTISLGASIKDDSTGAATSGDQLKGDSSFKLGGQYYFGSMLFFAEYASLGGTYASTAGNTARESKLGISSYNLGVESFIKGEGTHFFYGVKYAAYSEAQSHSSNANNGAKVETAVLPLWVGIEADATSWMVIRSAISQSVLIDSVKLTPSNTNANAGVTSATDSMVHDTAVSAGAGFKFNKLHLDFLLAAGTTGQLNSTSFGTNAALTYMF